MDHTLTVQEIHLFSQEFHKELTRLHETHQSQSYWSKMIMPRNKIQDIIDHLKGVRLLPVGKTRSWVESRKFKVFNKPSMGMADVLMEPTKEKLSVAGDASDVTVFPRYLRVVPRDDMFQTLLRIHLRNNHSTLRETLHLTRSVISNIPRYLVHKFILLCPVCSNNGATTNSAGLPYTPSRRCLIKARRRRKLMDQFQVDVLDLKGNPDGAYSFILHCMDHITGFHWLFPLAAIDPAEVAQNLVWGVFSLFGFPSELVSDYGKEFASQVIQQVVLLWPDELRIKNFLDGGSYKGDVTRRNTRNVTRFIDDMAAKRAARGDHTLKWSEWLPEIQFLLNATVLDVRTGKTPYEKVFRSQPVTPVPKNKLSPGKRNGSTFEEIKYQYPPREDDGCDGSEQQHEDLFHDDQQGQQQYITEEIVEHTDMATMHAFDSTVGDVVVVDMGGVEHTVAGVRVDTMTSVEGCSGGVGPLQHDADAAPPTHNNAVIEDNIVELLPDGLSFNAIETVEGTYTILPSANGSGGVAASIVPVSQADEFVVVSEGQEFGHSSGAAEQLKLDELQYKLEEAEELNPDKLAYVSDMNSGGSAAEKWVTLSADGGELQEAVIKPTVQEIKIASGVKQVYRIEAVTRKAVYVNPERNSASADVVAKTLVNLSKSAKCFKSSKSVSTYNNRGTIQVAGSSSSRNVLQLSSAGGSQRIRLVGSPTRKQFIQKPTPHSSPNNSSSVTLTSAPNKRKNTHQHTIHSGRTNYSKAKVSSPSKVAMATPQLKIPSKPTKVKTESANSEKTHTSKSVKQRDSSGEANKAGDPSDELQLRMVSDDDYGVISDDDDEGDDVPSAVDTKNAMQVLNKRMKKQEKNPQLYNFDDIFHGEIEELMTDDSA